MAKFQLVRTATAGKYCYVAYEVFPTSDTEFAPLLPDGPPRDPFGENTLRYITQHDSMTCYSIGPDKDDDRAAVSYDPTNGTISDGDIILRVPGEREYPFPRESVRASTPLDLRKQFPNGLPPDPFADTRGKSLGITNTRPPIVYSYGPDTNERAALDWGINYVPDVHYDPTNGTVSYGDLYLRIPR